MSTGIETLLQRARAAPSAGERHHSAWFALEALLKLATVARVQAWVQTGPSDEARGVLGVLSRPSAGHWLGLLRHTSEALPGEHPLAADLGGDPLPQAAAWAEAAVEEGVLPAELRRTARDGVLGLLSLGIAWRNEVIGHGAWRDAGFYDRFAVLLADAADALLLDGRLLRDGRVRGSVLTGEAWEVELAPLVLARAHPLLDTPQLGYLNRLKSRRRRGVYLDYVTGETFDGALDERLAELVPRSPRDSSSGSSSEPAYELLELLGRGGMGEVHLARQRATDRRVALKLLPATEVDDVTANERFRREVKALARVDHPAVVRLMAAGVHEGRPYYAMEHIDGLDLAQVRRRLFPEGPRRPGATALIDALAGLDPGASDAGATSSSNRRGSAYEQQLAALFGQVAEGLHQLHGAGVVHRDVKPDNLLLDGSGERLVLVDLGLAALTDASRDLTSADTRFLGTLRYVAPEQLHRGLQDLDGRADVFALGATLFEMLAGRALRDGETEERLIHQALYADPPRLAEVLPGVSPDLDAVVRKATARAPDDRYASAAALAADLQRVARGEPVDLAVPGRHRARLATAGGLLALLLAGGAWWAVQGPPPPATFVDVTWTLDGPVGVGAPLERPGPGFRVVHQDDGTVVVDHVNRAGVPAPWSPESWGDVERPRARDRDYLGEPCVSSRLMDDCLGSLTTLGEDRGVSRWTRAPPAADGTFTVTLEDLWQQPIAVHRYEPTEEGFRVEHLDRASNPTVSRLERVGVEAHQVDEQGRAIATRWLQIGGEEPMSAADGSWGHERSFDERGRLVSLTRVSQDGTPHRGASNTARFTWRYEDPRHPSLPTEVRSLAVGDLPVPGEDGCALVTLAWSAEGLLDTAACFAAGGEAAAFRDTRCSTLATTRAGRVETTRCLDPDGALRSSSQGWAALEVVRDAQARIIEVRHLDADGGLISGKFGVAHMRYQRDERGVIVQAGPHDGADGLPLRTAGEVVTWRVELDEGREVSRVLLDEQAQPADVGMGWVVRRLSWTEAGLPASVSLFALDGSPAVDQEGLHERRMTWEAGRMTHEQVFGADGRPTVRPDSGAHDIVRTYDAQGRNRTRAWFGVEAEPVLRLPVAESDPARRPDATDPEPMGYHREENTRDALGRLVRIDYLDTAGAPMLSDRGIASAEFRYDHLDREVERRFLGLDGELVLSDMGYAVRKREQWENPGAPFIKSQSYYDTQGALVTPHAPPSANLNACPELRNEFLSIDGDRVRNSQRCFDALGRPGTNQFGAHEIRGTYLVRPGPPLKSLALRLETYGVDGEPVSNPFSMAAVSFEYDELDRPTATVGESLPGGEPPVVARVQTTYDVRGFKVLQEAFGPDGEPVDAQVSYARPYALARRMNEFDDLGRLVEVHWFHADGRPGDGTVKPAIERHTYDQPVKVGEEWKPTRTDFLDAEGRPMEVGGLAAQTWRYSPLGRLRHHATYDAAGELVANGMGFAGYEQRWSPQGQLASVRFFDAAGEDVVGPTGCAVLEHQFDALGRTTGTSCDGQPR